MDLDTKRALRSSSYWYSYGLDWLGSVLKLNLSFIIY